MGVQMIVKKDNNNVTTLTFKGYTDPKKLELFTIPKRYHPKEVRR